MKMLPANCALTRWSLNAGLSIALVLNLWVTVASADDLPGKGTVVQPLSALNEEIFQTLLVAKALERLGYTINPIKQVEYQPAHEMIAKGEATFMANHWHPVNLDIYTKVGGDAKLYRKGNYIINGITGYVIDKKTANEYRIDRLDQLQDPRLAKLFDIDGDEKADLIGCNENWSCKQVIEHQLDAYGLRGTVKQTSKDYSTLITDIIARFNQGKPVFFFMWTPYWVPAVLAPGRDVIWLRVPFTAMPADLKFIDTALPNGDNYGFPVGQQRIIANRAFAEAHPDAAALFAIMRISPSEVSSQNLRMYKEEKNMADIERHANEWIKANSQTFDGWIQEALKAAKN